MGLNVTAKLGIAGTVGAILFALGAVLYVVFPDIVANKIKENMKIVNGTLTYKAWKEAPVPIYMEFYFFNVTNHQDYLTKHSKPNLQQLGPYTFREYRKKVNIKFHEDNDTVSYEQYKWFVFNPEKSNGTLKDNVTTLNVPFTSMAIKSVGKLTLLQQMMLPNFIKRFNAETFVTKTVGQLLYEGYKDELLSFLGEQANRTFLPNGTFGFQYGYNYTADGVYEVYTGVKDSSKFMQVARWNNSASVPYWNDTHCNKINGSDGSTFTPPVTKDSTIYLFSTDLCRSLYMRYEEEVYVHGIKTYRFAPPFSVMAGADLNADNKCFCPKTGCLGSGALSVGACKNDSPVVMSPPHFYQSDDRYYTSVVGLNKRKALHSTVLDIEPTTGVVMQAHRRLQINIQIKPMTHISLFKNFTDMLFPIFWIDENALWPEDRCEAFKDRVFKPQQIANAVTYALIAIGAFIILVVILFTIHTILKKMKSKPASYKVNDHQMNMQDKTTMPFLHTKQAPADART